MQIHFGHRTHTAAFCNNYNGSTIIVSLMNNAVMASMHFSIIQISKQDMLCSWISLCMCHCLNVLYQRCCRKLFSANIPPHMYVKRMLSTSGQFCHVRNFVFSPVTHCTCIPRLRYPIRRQLVLSCLYYVRVPRELQLQLKTGRLYREYTNEQ